MTRDGFVADNVKRYTVNLNNTYTPSKLDFVLASWVQYASKHHWVQKSVNLTRQRGVYFNEFD